MVLKLLFNIQKNNFILCSKSLPPESENFVSLHIHAIISGHPLTGDLYGVCVQSDGTWKTALHNTEQNSICEIPGMYHLRGESRIFRSRKRKNVVLNKIIKQKQKQKTTREKQQQKKNIKKTSNKQKQICAKSLVCVTTCVRSISG